MRSAQTVMPHFDNTHLPKKILLRCREQSRRMYYDVVFEVEEEFRIILRWEVMLFRCFGFLLSAALSLAASQALASSSVPVPLVSGPIPSPDIPGAPSHNYTFFASTHDLASHGYLEEEFFIKGTARTYNTPPGQTGTVKDSGLHYLTRVVVRRPADAKRFNGTVL